MHRTTTNEPRQDTMKLKFSSHFLSLTTLLIAPAWSIDDNKATFDAITPANTNNLGRASANKKTYVVGFNAKAKTTGPAARCNSLASAAGGSAVRSDYRDGGGVDWPETVVVRRAPATPLTSSDRRDGGGIDRPETAALQ